MSPVFLLTGSSRGLGRAIAEAVLQSGHQLVATARSPQSLDDLVAAHGDRILPLASASVTSSAPHSRRAMRTSDASTS
jgi:NAD(P)-dependent dehydrogenase (short-subunit alcohol dehydrogenase family)